MAAKMTPDEREAQNLPRYAGKAKIRDGNAFAIMAAVAVAIRKQGATSEEVSAYRRRAMSGDYDNLLVVSGAMIDLV
jgi:hypothetical protein